LDFEAKSRKKGAIVPTKNPIGIQFIERQASAARSFRAVLDLILMLLNSLLSLGRSQVTLQAEIIALRHQLIVLQCVEIALTKVLSE